ncbi:MAG TPA: CDP-alcohol phosphatidyltransferase family protein [Planctomycetota bacterium]|jgi:hypothetical protein
MAETEPTQPKDSLTALRAHARFDEEGREKTVLSLHDRICARVLAPPLAWLALRLGVSADTVTLLSVIVGLAGAALLALQTPVALIAAAALLQFSYLLDCADGDVARARGTACLNGYMRDTFRHYLVGPALFCGMAMGSFARHPDWFVVLAGVMGVFLSTRIVGDISDRVTLDGLIKRLKLGAPAGASGTGSQQLTEAARGTMKTPLGWLRPWLLPDMAIMNWVTVAALIDALWLGIPRSGWLALDWVLLILSSVQTLLKAGGLCLLWRRGVACRVEEIAQQIERAQSQRPK